MTTTTTTIRIPDHWTLQKIELLLEFVNEVSDAIWNQYGDQLCVYCATQEAPDPDNGATNDDCLNDDLPY